MKRKSYLYAYGTLRKDARGGHNLYPGLTYVETLKIPGQIYDLGWFPGIVLGLSGSVVCDKFIVDDEETWDHLDAYEGYHKYSPRCSLYIRTQFRESYAYCCGFIYEYNRSVEGKVLISSGDWVKYERDKRQLAGERLCMAS